MLSVHNLLSVLRSSLLRAQDELRLAELRESLEKSEQLTANMVGPDYRTASPPLLISTPHSLIPTPSSPLPHPHSLIPTRLGDHPRFLHHPAEEAGRDDLAGLQPDPQTHPPAREYPTQLHTHTLTHT